MRFDLFRLVDEARHVDQGAHVVRTGGIFALALTQESHKGFDTLSEIGGAKDGFEICGDAVLPVKPPEEAESRGAVRVHCQLHAGRSVPHAVDRSDAVLLVRFEGLLECRWDAFKRVGT